MIKKFQEYISEGFWKPAIQRVSSGEKREEDKIRTNIKEMKPVDIGMSFCFADVDLEIDGETKFTWDEVKEYLDKLGDDLDGWRLPHSDEIARYLEKTGSYDIEYDDNHEYYTAIEKGKNGDKLIFGPEEIDLSMRFWLDLPKKRRRDCIYNHPSDRNYLVVGSRIIKKQWTNPLLGGGSKHGKLRVRLVKTKRQFEGR